MVVKVKPYIQNEDYNNEIVLHVRLMLTGDMVAFFLPQQQKHKWVTLSLGIFFCLIIVTH